VKCSSTYRKDFFSFLANDYPYNKGRFLKRQFSCSKKGQTWDLCFIFCADVATAVFEVCQFFCTRMKKKIYSAGEDFSLRRVQERPCFQKGVGGVDFFMNDVTQVVNVIRVMLNNRTLRYGSDNMHLFNISEVKWLSKQASPIHQVLKLQQIFLTTKDSDTFTLHVLKLGLGNYKTETFPLSISKYVSQSRSTPLRKKVAICVNLRCWNMNENVVNASSSNDV